MRTRGRGGPLLLLVMSVCAAPSALYDQHAGPRDGPSVAAAVGTVSAAGEAGVRPVGSLAARLVLPRSPLVLRADAAAGTRADDHALATVALGIRVLEHRGSSLYVLGGVGAYSGPHARRGGRNVGGGVEVRPRALRGRAAFLEGRAHAPERAERQGREIERLTTIVAGLWW